MHTSNGVCEISVLYTQKHQHIWFLSCTQSTAQMHSAEKLSINPANTWAPRFSAVTQLTVLLVHSFNWLYTTEHTMLLQNYKWIQDFFKPKSPQICFYKELPNKLMKGQNDSHELNCPRPNTHHRAHDFCVRFQEGYKPQNCLCLWTSRLNQVHECNYIGFKTFNSVWKMLPLLVFIKCIVNMSWKCNQGTHNSLQCYSADVFQYEQQHLSPRIRHGFHITHI